MEIAIILVLLAGAAGVVFFNKYQKIVRSPSIAQAGRANAIVSHLTEQELTSGFNATVSSIGTADQFGWGATRIVQEAEIAATFLDRLKQIKGQPFSHEDRMALRTVLLNLGSNAVKGNAMDAYRAIQALELPEEGGPIDDSRVSEAYSKLREVFC